MASFDIKLPYKVQCMTALRAVPSMPIGGSRGGLEVLEADVRPKTLPSSETTIHILLEIRNFCYPG